MKVEPKFVIDNRHLELLGQYQNIKFFLYETEEADGEALLYVITGEKVVVKIGISAICNQNFPILEPFTFERFPKEGD